MLLKAADDKSEEIRILLELKKVAPPRIKQKIQRELNMLKKGLKGEKTSAYYLDFYFKNKKSQILIHDLRLECNGRVAQIDHLLIDRFLDVLVFETKSCDSEIRIDEDGEFSRYDSYSKKYAGMESPIKQNERHIEVLRDVFGVVPMPSRLGIRLEPTFHSVVLVEPGVILKKPKNAFNNVIKSEKVDDYYDSLIDKASSLAVIKTASRVVGFQTLEEISRDLIKLHKPITPNYAKKFGIQESSVTQTKHFKKKSLPKRDALVCGKCGSKDVTILHGRYGYYFSCSSCGKNSSIKLFCEHEGHSEKLRKQGDKYFRECPSCNTSILFYTAAVKASS